MHIDSIINRTREIVKNQYAGMKALDMDQSEPAMQKKDLFGQLQAFLPDMTIDDMGPLYHELEQNGHVTLITNDTVTFSKDFIGE